MTQIQNINPKSFLVNLSNNPLDWNNAFQLLLKTMTQLTEMPVGILCLFGKSQFAIVASLGEGVSPQCEQLTYFNRYIQTHQDLLLIKDTTFNNDIKNMHRDQRIPVFYCGVPISIGQKVAGSLAVLDYMPRNLKNSHISLLHILAQSIAAQWELKFSQDNIDIDTISHTNLGS